jgi:hypothetical protein
VPRLPARRLGPTDSGHVPGTVAVEKLKPLSARLYNVLLQTSAKPAAVIQN